MKRKYICKKCGTKATYSKQKWEDGGAGLGTWSCPKCGGKTTVKVLTSSEEPATVSS